MNSKILASSRRSRSWLLVAALVGVLARGVIARAESALFSLAIGYNGAPADADAGAVRPLRYADDDAAALPPAGARSSAGARSCWRSSTPTPRRASPAWPARRAHRRWPEIDRDGGGAEPRLAAATQAGLEPVVLVFYSGHGAAASDGRPAWPCSTAS